MRQIREETSKVTDCLCDHCAVRIWRRAVPEGEYEKLKDENRELFLQNEQYRVILGCPSCGEDHPREAMCPPHEVRTTGQDSMRGIIRSLNVELHGAQARIKELEAERDGLRKEAADSEASFNLRWSADMRAIKRWQAAHPGKELTWPDHADLVVWLLEQLEKADGKAND